MEIVLLFILYFIAIAFYIVGKIDSTTTEHFEKILKKLKNKRIKNIISKIQSKHQQYKEKDKWLIRIRRKSGTIITIWKNTFEDTREIIKWVNKNDSDKDINIFKRSENNIIVLNRDDIEEVECIKFSLLERSIDIPIKSFMQQDTAICISARKIIIMFLTCLCLTTAFFYYGGSSFIATGSYDTYKHIIQNTYSLFIIYIHLMILLLSIIALITNKKSIDDFYCDKPTLIRKSVGYSLLILLFTPYIINKMLINFIMSGILVILQSYGYFIL